MSVYPRFEQRPVSYDAFTVRSLSYFSHIHPHVELVRVLEGEFQMTVGKREALLQKGDIAIVFPGVVHSYQTEVDSLLFLMIVRPELTGEYARLFTTLQPDRPFLLQKELHPDIPWSLSRLQEEEQTPLTPALRKSYLMVAAGRLLELLTLEVIPPGWDTDLLHRLLPYLDEHFREALTLERIAADLGVSRSHLSRCFTKRIGTGFYHYLGTLRTEFAESMLSDINRSITEICYEAGFESLNTFYRAFKARYGMTPGAYRRTAYTVTQ